MIILSNLLLLIITSFKDLCNYLLVRLSIHLFLVSSSFLRTFFKNEPTCSFQMANIAEI